jgi:hypothetical protein
MLKNSLILLFVLFLTSCGTLIDGGYQLIHIETTCTGQVLRSQCKVTNEFFTWETQTPVDIQIHRGKKDLVLICNGKNFKNQKLIVPSHANIPMYSNFFFGGGAGAVLDNNDGAGFNYPNEIKFEVKSCS